MKCLVEVCTKYDVRYLVLLQGLHFGRAVDTRLITRTPTSISIVSLELTTDFLGNSLRDSCWKG